MEKIRAMTLPQILPYLLIILGLIGFFASFTLTIEKFHYLQNPDQALGCDINPILSCGSVMGTDQATTFGFTNSLVGVAGFAALIALGFGLLAGATYKKWLWQGVWLGSLFGVGFMHYLFYQTLYRIGSLCPYCMVVWVVMIPLFWYTTLYVLRQKYLRTPRKLKKVVAFLQGHHGNILVVWFLVLAGLILNRFWYYWSTLL